MKKFTLAPYVRTGFLDGTLHFGFGSLRHLINEKEIQNCVLDAAAFLKKPHSMEEVFAFLRNTGYGLNIIKDTLDILLNNFLIPEGSYDQQERHSRSFLFYSLSGADRKGSRKHFA